MGGMMGGGQSQTSNETSVQTKTPYAPAVPGLQRSLTDADTLYTAGVGGGIYNGQRVANFSDDTTAGIIGTRDQAASDNAGALGTSYLQNLLGSNGISATTQQGLGMLAGVPNVDTSRLSGLADKIGSASNPINQTANSFMSGARDLTTQPQLQALYDKSQAPSAAETNLSSTAAGAYLDPTTNPWVSKLAAVSADNALNATKQAFAASGRYGSGNFAGATTKAVNDTQSALFADQYNKERANQLSANTMIDSARQAASSAGLGITNAISGVQSTNNQQRLAGAGLGQAQEAAQAGVLGQVLGGDEFNSNLGVTKAQGFIGAGQQGQAQALQAAGLLPQTDALRYAPAQQLLGVGNIQENKYQQGLDALQQQFSEQQQTPWQLLSQYAAFPTGIGNMGGTTVGNSTKKTETQGAGGLQSILGAGLGLLSLGTGGGASLGGGLLSKAFGSDERLKSDVREVGKLHDGTPVHSYRYRGDDRVQIGLLADQVAQRNPEAVGPIGLGDLLGVNYEKATDKAAAMADRSGKRSGGRPRRPAVREEMGGPGLLELTVGSDPAKGPRPGGQAGLGHLLAILAPQEPAPIAASEEPRPRAKTRPAHRKAA